jgi:uncharacterized protein (TIGR00297 family)
MQLLIALRELPMAAGWPPLGIPSGLEFGFAIVLVVSFALVAWGMRAVTAGGAMWGALIAFLVYVAGGFGGFLTLVTLFVLTAVTTRFGHSKKHSINAAEKEHGRAASQVIANLGAATLCGLPLLFVDVMSAVLLAGMVAALAEAAADTVSSEVGQALRHKTVLITTFKLTESGHNGGVSAAGTVAGVLAAVVVALVAVLTRVVSPRQFWVIAGFAIAGMLLDSVLGATLERPGKLGNDSVNFTGSSFSAFGAVLVTYLLG